MLPASIGVGGGMPNLRATYTGQPKRWGGTPVRSPMQPLAEPMSFKKGGRVRRGGWARVHKGERVIPAKKRSSISRTMGGVKKKPKAILQRVGHELKTNPPRVLAKTARKSGAKRTAKQKVAILLSKARRAGAKV